MKFEDRTVSTEADCNFSDTALCEIEAETLFKELNELVGLSTIKKDIQLLIDENRRRKEENIDGKSRNTCLCVSFIGNPGTGKTMVVRLYGKILKALGLVRNSNIVETSRIDFMDRTQKEIVSRVRKLCESAYGGILFIDDAYTLMLSENDIQGRWAVDTLCEEMENHGNDLIIILSGHKDGLDEFMRLNPIFKNKVSKELIFEDYNAQELLKIFMLYMGDEELTITDEAKDKLAIYIQEICANKDEFFCNGRVMRNLFEEVKMNMIDKVQDLALTGDARYLITIEDIEALLQVQK